MRVVTVVFPPLRVSRDFIDYPYFANLGAAQAAAVVRAAGHETTLLDALAMPGATLAPLPDNYVLLGAPVATVAARVPPRTEAFVVAFTPFHRPPARDPIFADLLVRLRAGHPEAPIVLADLYQSGQHVVDAPPADTLAAYPEVDVFVRYEAEDLLVELLEKLCAEGRPASSYSLNGGEPAPLDALPLPAWDLVDMDAYFAFQEDLVRGLGRPNWAFPIARRSAPLVTTRGCPYRCLHCSSNPTSRVDGKLVAPKTQRRYSPAYLDRLFGDLVSRGVRQVHLLDELVNVNERHFDAVMELLAKHDLEFEVPNGMRADYILPQHLATMKGRMTTLSVSAESGVQRVVTEVVDKQLDLTAVTETARGARDVGLPMLVHFMIGLPGETKQEMNGTLEFAMTLHEDTGAWPSVQFATPLPGTRLAAVGKERGRVLPVIEDFGPHFQKSPSMATEAATMAELERFKWTFDQRMRANEGAKKVVLRLNYRCNNRCTFCVTGLGTPPDGDVERQRALIARYRKAGATALAFDGGEPTLSPSLVPLVQLARRIGYQEITVTTNGRMAAYAETARRLVTSGLTRLVTSIHGPDAETHAANVGVAEAFDQTCAGVKNFVRFRPRGVELGVNVTVTRSNQRKLVDIAALALELGVDAVSFLFVTPFGPATADVAPDTSEAAAEVKRAIDAYRDRLRVSVENLPFCFLPGYEEHVAFDTSMLEGRTVFVDGGEVDLFQYLRERRVKKAVCETCPHSIFCGGFYEVEGAPEPRWLVRPERLVRAPSTEA